MIKQARQALEAEAAAAAARDRANQAAAADADASEQQKLAGKVAKAQEKPEAARELAIEKAKEAGLEHQGLEPQVADAMPYRGLAHRADGSPTPAAKRNHDSAEGCACTDQTVTSRSVMATCCRAPTARPPLIATTR
jgi:hypothetical protein